MMILFLSSFFYLNNIKICRVGISCRYGCKESNYNSNDEYSLTNYELGCGRNRVQRDNILNEIFHKNKDNGDLDKYLIN